MRKGARLGGMTNECELLINAVMNDKPKMLKGLNQKVHSWLISSPVGLHGHTAIGGKAESKYRENYA